jgi:sec-independent protein translocase protein TatA
MRSTMPTPGPLEIIIVLIIVLVIFGPKRLPDLGKSLGRGMREFKDSVTGKDKEHEQIDSVKTVGDKPEPPATTATTSTTREQQP